jgi:hypothetical protein
LDERVVLRRVEAVRVLRCDPLERDLAPVRPFAEPLRRFADELRALDRRLELPCDLPLVC